MLIWRCDNCGHEATQGRIVGNEFGYLDHGFQTLSVAADGKRDLCRKCFRVAERAFSEASKRNGASVWEAVRASFGAH